MKKISQQEAMNRACNQEEVYMLVKIDRYTTIGQLNSSDGYVIEDDIVEEDNAEEENHEEDKPEEEVKKTKSKEKKIDAGKVRALYEGNWTQKQIAEEFFTTVHQIRKVLKEEGLIA